MGLARLQRGERFWYKDSAWEITQTLQNRAIVARNTQYGHEVTLQWEEIAQAWNSGTLRFGVAGKAARPDTSAALQTQYLYPDLAFIPERYHHHVMMRYAVIRPLLDLPGRLRTRLDVIQRLEEARQTLPSEQVALLPQSPQTVYRWMADYKRSQGDARALIPGWKQSGGRGKARRSGLPELIDAVVEQRYLLPERPTVQHVTDLVMSQLVHDNKFRSAPDQVPVPKPHALYMQVARRIARLNARDVLARRHGERAARHQFDSVDQAPTAQRVLERVLIDHTQLDLFLVDEIDRMPIGRPTVTFCIDAFSSYPLGIYVGFEPPSVLTAMHCLGHAILPKADLRAQYPGLVHEWKSYGVPETLVVDNGREFIGKSMADACLLLQTELVQAPIRSPEFKGAIERWFGTLNKQLLHNMPGTTFSNVIDRKDYDPAKHAVISLAKFMEMLHIFVVDYYSERPTSAGIIPAKRWSDGCAEYPPPLPWNRDDLLLLLGAVAERRIGRQGIEFECLFYDSPDLTVLRTKLSHGRTKEPVKMKYDPADLGRVWVYDKYEDQWIEARCTDRNYADGLSLWKHKVIKRYAREQLSQVDYAALADAKARIQAIVDSEYTETKRAATRKRLQRWRSGGFDSERLKVELPKSQPVPVKPSLPGPVAAEAASLPTQPPRKKPRKEPAAPGGTASRLPVADDDLDLSTWRSRATGPSPRPKE